MTRQSKKRENTNYLEECDDWFKRPKIEIDEDFYENNEDIEFFPEKTVDIKPKKRVINKKKERRKPTKFKSDQSQGIILCFLVT